MKIPTQACEILISAKSDHVHAHTPVHILDYHLICTGSWEISIAWLQLSHSGSGYPATTISKAFTKGTTPRQNNTHRRIVLRRLLTLPSGHHAEPHELNVDTLWMRCTLGEQTEHLVVKCAHRKCKKVLSQGSHQETDTSFKQEQVCKLNHPHREQQKG